MDKHAVNQHFAVIGHPVSHSLSPHIHQAFGRQLAIPLSYVAIDTEDLDTTLLAFDGSGANITLPHKQHALTACATLSDRARRAGAVNTLVRVVGGPHDGSWHGDNTDGAGLVRDLTGRHGLDLRKRRTLLLGAGGGARGVAPTLLDAGIGDLFVINRTPERADALADALGEPGRVHPRYLSDLKALGEFDLIINATSATRDAELPALPMSLAGRRTAAIDLSYGEAAIPFLAWARGARCHDVIDGLGMLVEQAAESFALWHGVRPDTDAVYAELRERDAVLVNAD